MRGDLPHSQQGGGVPQPILTPTDCVYQRPLFVTRESHHFHLRCTGEAPLVELYS